MAGRHERPLAGLHAIVVPGPLRDSLMILDGLLELHPPGEGGRTMIITDQMERERGLGQFAESA